MIMMDQIRNDSLPNHSVFKRLHKKGVLCSEMISYAPYTTASLHAVLTGIYGSRNGMNSYYGATQFKKDECYTMAQYLQDRKYYTQADIVSNIFIPHQGFDAVLTYDENNVDLISRHKEMLRDLQASHKKFFAFLDCGIVHREMIKNVSQKYITTDQTYFGYIERNLAKYESYVQKACVYLDCLFDFLEESGLMRQALIIVFTDHGVGVGEKPGEKTYGVYTYDYTIKTWAYFIYPSLLPAGSEVAVLTRNVDILPTLMEILRIKPSSRHLPMDGESILALLRGKKQEPRSAFSETGGLEGPHPSPYAPNVKCIRTKEWKLIYNIQTQRKELYNIKDDPIEANNLVGVHLDIEEELWKRLQPYLNNSVSSSENEILIKEYQALGYLPSE
ncbi:MAG: sulfatase-like hydrolase/transferase [Candidatus Omnitrophica bacterium]|nr:sulfatase-like hydrolase/transferase [Candidatus Omnitrophota bacterium]